MELQRLCGIGHTEDTSLSILPISMHCSTDAKKDELEEDSREMPVCTFKRSLFLKISMVFLGSRSQG